MMADGKPVVNGWLQIPSTVSAEVMAHQGWDSLTVDMQHGLVDYTNALPKESLDKLDEIMSTDGVDGIYIGPADLSLAIGEKPGFDRAEDTKAYSEILRILEHAKKNNIFAGIHNGTPEYAQKMIDKGFNFVTIGADQRAMSAGAKAIVEKMKGSISKKESETY